METFIISNEFFFYFSQLYTEKKEGKRGRQREREISISLSFKEPLFGFHEEKKCQINEMKSHRIRNRWKRYRIVFLGKYFNYDNEYFTEV